MVQPKPDVVTSLVPALAGQRGQLPSLCRILALHVLVEACAPAMGPGGAPAFWPFISVTPTYNYLYAANTAAGGRIQVFDTNYNCARHPGPLFAQFPGRSPAKLSLRAMARCTHAAFLLY